MTWLKTATIAAGLPKTSIVQVLKNNMAAFEPARDHSVVHASDITKPNFCPRHWAILDINGATPKGSWVGPALRATYDLGHATADVFIHKWADGLAWGNWECWTCGSHKTMGVKPHTCNSSQIGKQICQWKYREMTFVSKEYGISGSLDVLMDLGAQKLAITELKTYAADEFDQMLAPLPEHRIRTDLYMKIVADSGSIFTPRINLHEARILYVSRGYGRANKDHGNEVLPFREFTVKRGDGGKDLELMLKKAKQIKIFRHEKGGVPSGICATPLDKYAKSCSTCKECFSGSYPAAQEPL